MPVGAFICPFLVLVILGTLAWVIFTASRQHNDRTLGTETACPRCGHPNPTYARYCAHCGAGKRDRSN